jgi:hypothetical protein
MSRHVEDRRGFHLRKCLVLPLLGERLKGNAGFRKVTGVIDAGQNGSELSLGLFLRDLPNDPEDFGTLLPAKRRPSVRVRPEADVL